MMDLESELKKCPFCGASSVKMDVGEKPRIYCEKCHLSLSIDGGQVGNEMVYLWKLWNKRAVKEIVIDEYHPIYALFELDMVTFKRKRYVGLFTSEASAFEHGQRFIGHPMFFEVEKQEVIA